MKKILTKFLTIILSILITVSSLGVVAFADETTENEKTKLEEIRELLSAVTYAEYLKAYSDKTDVSPDVNVVINGVDFIVDLTDADVKIMTNYKGSDGQTLLIPEEGNVSWTFTLPETGFYNLKIEYYPVDKVEEYDIIGRGNSIERAILFDGEFPFKESRNVEMTRVYSDIYEEISDEAPRGFVYDIYGNETRATKLETPEWSTVTAKDSTGYYLKPFKFYLEAGEHTLTFEEVQEPVIIKSITICGVEELKSYEQVKNEYVANGYVAPNTPAIKIDAEKATSTSSEIVYATYDRTSSITEPQDPALIRLNTIGGVKWQTVGQWIRWTVEIEEDGLYQIAPRFKQSVYEGVYTSRELRIDGEVPFEEARTLRFNFSDGWQVEPLNSGKYDENGNLIYYDFYLTAGTHTIEMCVVLGDMAELLREVENAMVTLNTFYRKILMITGPTPDYYRDYEFGKKLPDVIEGMGKEAEKLYSISAELQRITGTKGQHTATLENVAYLLQKMHDDEYKIAPNFSTLETYIASLGTWVMTTSNQPLELDYILVTPTGSELPRAEANFWESLVFELKAFFLSFFSDYSSMGAKEVGEDEQYKEIEVWTASSRDQSQIIRSMIDDDFSAQHKIKVNLKLVAAGTLLPATLSGTGPDVSLTNTAQDVINYAIRSAVLPITDMEGFDEVMARFTDAAAIPITLYGETYALPETQTFQMLFYRMDILAELGLDVPKTWDDVYDLIPVLQSNNLEFGLPNSLAGTILFLYQRDEGLYREAVDGNELTFGMSTNLDSNVALDCFKQMCELFTMYGFPYSYDFANRFRSGEMPIALADYTFYNQLMVFAPEIRGLWEFTLVPGTVREDGSINHNVAAAVTACMMMRGCEDKEAAWEFMKWWTDAEAQGRFGTEKQALLGPSGQYATANLEALYKQPWSAADRKNLQEQFDNLTATPEMPGGYIIARYVEFAFLAVYNDGDNPVEALLEYIDSINSELTRKREEFDLPTLENYKSQK